jgi:hypothetical protein
MPGEGENLGGETRTRFVWKPEIVRCGNASDGADDATRGVLFGACFGARREESENGGREISARRILKGTAGGRKGFVPSKRNDAILFLGNDHRRSPFYRRVSRVFGSSEFTDRLTSGWIDLRVDWLGESVRGIAFERVCVSRGKVLTELAP